LAVPLADRARLASEAPVSDPSGRMLIPLKLEMEMTELSE
jgi:hypothetical protein